MPRYLGQAFSEKVGELAGLPPDEREVVAYGLEYLLVGIFGLSIMLLLGLVFGLFWETVFILCCWVPMRIFAGGAHCKALWRCTIVNCIGILTALLVTGVIVQLLPAAVWIVAAVVWALLAVGLWAPKNSERPINEPLRRQRLRHSAFIYVIIAGSALLYISLAGPEYWQVLAAAGAMGLAAGGIMISPMAFHLMDWLDHNIENLGQLHRKGGDTS